MTVLLVIVKLDVDFEGLNKPFRVLDKKKLLLLDENWVPRLAEDVQKQVVLI